MSLQQLGHSHNQQVHGMPIDPAGLGPRKGSKLPKDQKAEQ
jgi:hypothetical protein